MSTDLDLHLAPVIKIMQISDNKSSASNDENTTDHSCVVDEEECHTPRSPRHTIPAMLSCPPPPKKPRRMVGDSCRRKLRDLRFFEAVAGEEIESFFRTVEAHCMIANGGSTKRKLCLM
ncbi:hypothetical protein F511_06783 [Dorcoceras hygrometricum]|uniref:Uncharacterized protein n=1 Tax=Dorcoceras hygrometricum TaxID=472368 RepID=A0A2Z7DD95_9LAMI|nr:hypothetical protein F511_06783 [Dorcoceras hygrometricum]